MTTNQPLDFDNALEFLLWADPDKAAILTDWQCEELLRLSGRLDGRAERFEYTKDAPYKAAIVAANGAGKDSIIIATWHVFLLACRRNSYGYVSSGSTKQLETQTERHIDSLIDKVNARLGYKLLDGVRQRKWGNGLNTNIDLFVTDETSKAEGAHPKEPGAIFSVTLNEIKAITDEMIGAFLRCSGYTHWLEISSPGLEASGHFYKTVTEAAVSYPALLVPGQWYTRRISAADCPHIPKAHIQQALEFGGGVDSAYYRSVIEALFTFSSETFVIPDWAFSNYPRIVPNLLKMPRSLGVDLSFGGDETVIQCWEGSRMLWQRVLRIDNEPLLISTLVQIFEESGVEPSRIYVDAKGIGKGIVHWFHEKKWPVTGVMGDSPAWQSDEFARRNIELWWLLRKLIIGRLIELPTDAKLLRQLGRRRFEISKSKTTYQKKQLQDKKAARAADGESPDRADCMSLAFFGLLGSKLPESPLAITQIPARIHPDDKPILVNLQQAAAMDADLRKKTINIEEIRKQIAKYEHDKQRKLHGKGLADHRNLYKYRSQGRHSLY